MTLKGRESFEKNHQNTGMVQRIKRKRRRRRKQKGGIAPFLIPLAALIGKAVATGAASAAAGHGVKQHLKRKDHIFTKEFWTGPKEYKRGGYIYSADGKYRRKA